MSLHFSQPEADVWLPEAPSGTPADPAAALARVTHLCVAAHQDDIEIMAHAGICDCLDSPDRAFGGVVVTDGGGAPRSGAFAKFTDAQLCALRRDEQREAARVGRYAIQVQLAHPSASIKQAPDGDSSVADDLMKIFSHCRPEVLYLHNPADKHDTHVALTLRCIEVLRKLPPEQQPARVLGCEVWRDLDWLSEMDKVRLDAGRRPQLAVELLRCFDSQNSGGKRYDRAAPGRRTGHATFDTSHATDEVEGITWAMDLTPLLQEPETPVVEFTRRRVHRFLHDVETRIMRWSRG